MKRIVYTIILITLCVSSYSQIKINAMDKKRATETNVSHFFNCMVSNESVEKVAKNNYYLFGIIEKKLYYGRIKAGFFKEKIKEIYKIDIEELGEKIPNYLKLDGVLLREIVLNEIAKTSGIENKSEICIQNISFKLDKNILVYVEFRYRGLVQHKTYKLSSSNFKILY